MKVNAFNYAGDVRRDMSCGLFKGSLIHKAHHAESMRCAAGFRPKLP